MAKNTVGITINKFRYTLSKVIISLLFLKSIVIFSQIMGSVTSEERMPLREVLVYNTDKFIKVKTDYNGKFIIEAELGNTLCFLKDEYEMQCIKVKDFHNIDIKLTHKIIHINEVIIYPKEFKKMIQGIKVDDSKEKMYKLLGLPKVKKDDKVAPSVKKDILFPLLSTSPTIKIEETYEIISGKAKKKNRLYAYEKLQNNIKWIKDRVEPNFFLVGNISEDEISLFIEFCIRSNFEIQNDIKSNNIDSIKMKMIDYFDKYIDNSNRIK